MGIMATQYPGQVFKMIGKLNWPHKFIMHMIGYQWHWDPHHLLFQHYHPSLCENQLNHFASMQCTPLCIGPLPSDLCTWWTVYQAEAWDNVPSHLLDIWIHRWTTVLFWPHVQWWWCVMHLNMLGFSSFSWVICYGACFQFSSFWKKIFSVCKHCALPSGL